MEWKVEKKAKKSLLEWVKELQNDDVDDFKFLLFILILSARKMGERGEQLLCGTTLKGNKQVNTQEEASKAKQNRNSKKSV